MCILLLLLDFINVSQVFSLRIYDGLGIEQSDKCCHTMRNAL